MRNLRTGLSKARSRDPMRDYDRLPEALRHWLAQAALPWSARSVRPAWDRALKRTGGCETRAMEYMARVEKHLLVRDAPRVWGSDAPPGV